MLLIHEDRSARSADPAGGRALRAEYGAYMRAIQDSKEMVAGSALQDVETATTVRVRAGKTSVRDGPFAETTELLGGYFIVAVEDLAAAVDLAARIPAARTGVVEVRAIREPGGA